MRRGVDSILPSKPHRRLKIEPVGLACARVCGGGVRARAKCERMGKKGGGERCGKSDVNSLKDGGDTRRKRRRWEVKKRRITLDCVHGALR